MITLFLLLWLLPIFGNVYLDRTGRKPNYLIMFILRGMAAILHGILFNPHNLYDYLPIFLFQITSFWLLFEIFLNVIRHKPLLYFDNVEHDSGWIDKIFSKLGYTFHAFAKVLALAVCVFSIIVILNRH